MALFAFVRTVDGGVEQLARDSRQPVLVVFQDSRFCPLTSELPLRYAQSIRQIEGVEAVLPTLVFVNSCRSNLDLVTLHGVEAQSLRSIYEFDVLGGSVEDYETRSDGAVVGARLAERRNLSVGQRVRLGDVDVHVSAVVKGKAAGVDNLAFVHLDQLALSQKRQGGATQIMVRMREGIDAEQAAEAIDAVFRTDEARTDTKSMQAFVAAAVGEIAEVVEFSRLLGYLAVLVVALVLANTVFISAQSRSGEMAVLETVGLTKSRLAAILAAEGTVLGVLGGILGIGTVLGALTIFPVTLGVEGYGIDVAPSLRVVLTSLAATVAVAVLASLVPAVAVSRRPLHLGVKAE
jgi:putative ABC transport system permease protein